MDPISGAIVTALATGVVSGVSETSKKMIIDAYGAIKTAIIRKFSKNCNVVEAMEQLEKKPDSKSLQEKFKKEIEAAKAANDRELRKLAKALLKVLQDTPEGQVKLKKYNITAEKIGVLGDNAHIEGGIHFNNE